MTAPARTLTLTDFLLARITEDEAVAQAEVRLLAGSARRGGKMTAARRVADCEAKRRIVEQLVHIEVGVLLVGTNHAEYRSALLFAIRVLALPYADHPDYDPTWRP